jgi:hypothetical protein
VSLIAATGGSASAHAAKAATATIPVLFIAGQALLLELIPSAAKIALLQNGNGIGADAGQRDVEAATLALGRQMILLKIGSWSDLEAAFVSAVRQQATRCSSVPIRYSRTGALKSSHLRHVMRCPRVTLGANLRRLVG